MGKRLMQTYSMNQLSAESFKLWERDTALRLDRDVEGFLQSRSCERDLETLCQKWRLKEAKDQLSVL